MYDENNKPEKVPKEILAVKLPNLKEFKDAGNPLDQIKEWNEVEIDGKNI